MKRMLIIGGSIAFLVFLIVRMVFLQYDRTSDLQREFVSALNYDLSARVDSVGLFNREATPIGFVYITITRGTFDNNEKKVARSLRKARKFRFLIPQKDGKLQVFSHRAREHEVGDSLVISSVDDQMVLFREGKKILERKISEHLREEGN